MKRFGSVAISALLSWSASSVSEGGEAGSQPADASQDALYEDHCHDQEAWRRIEDFLRQHPRDPLVIRTYALRLGICQLMDTKKITLEQGIELFDLERQRVLMERQQEEANRQRKPPIPADNMPPLG